MAFIEGHASRTVRQEGIFTLGNFAKGGGTTEYGYGAT